MFERACLRNLRVQNEQCQITNTDQSNTDQSMDYAILAPKPSERVNCRLCSAAAVDTAYITAHTVKVINALFAFAFGSTSNARAV